MKMRVVGLMFVSGLAVLSPLSVRAQTPEDYRLMSSPDDLFDLGVESDPMGSGQTPDLTPHPRRFHRF